MFFARAAAVPPFSLLLSFLFSALFRQAVKRVIITMNALIVLMTDDNEKLYQWASCSEKDRKLKCATQRKPNNTEIAGFIKIQILKRRCL
jgi:formaldehyde-activating enzyme involved in methanogenesis